MDERKTPDCSFEPDIPRPAGWRYKSRKIGNFSTSWYASPRIQLGMVAFVCFLCPGIFNALSGMGGGGKSDPSLADKMNIALNSTFAVVGFFAGTVVNRVGVRISLSFGGIGYCIYSISLLVSEHAYVPGFNIFAGAFLGVCAGLLWAAQGTIMMSYPIEQQKGRYFAWFWGIFNVGACIENKTVGDGTYIAFILMFAGACGCVCLCDADKVVRRDGSRVILMKHPSWKSEG
ncbi:hypothetical protein PDIDSM_5696 [Penicillium digitatum]|nr:hypothetical protein PDIDSM_5696 [Penicillium digitatum]